MLDASQPDRLYSAATSLFHLAFPHFHAVRLKILAFRTSSSPGNRAPRFKRRVLARACLGVVLLAGPAAYGDELDTLQIGFRTWLTMDSNLFRQAAGSASPGIVEDRQTSSELALSLSHSIGRQGLRLSTTLVEHKYDTNTYLNHTSKNYRAEWDWVLGSQLHGVLLLERAEALSSFSSFAIGNLRNIQTVDTKQVLAELDVFGGWSVVGGLTETTLKNSASNFTLDSDALVLTPEIGLRYRFPSGTTITLSHRSSDGEYTSRQTPDLILLLDTGYKETENSLAVNWPVSGKSTINARVAQVERHYDNLSERNYDGTRLQIDYALKATSKITVNVAYRQDMVPYTDTRSSYYLARTLGVAPLWQITPKLALRLNLSRERRDFRGAAPGGTLRPEETVTLRGLTMDWSPLDMIRLSASHQRESRDSPNQAESFDANVSQISANLRF